MAEPATTKEIDCTPKICPHIPQIYILKRRHPGKNLNKYDILYFKFQECVFKKNFSLLLFIIEIGVK